MTRKKAIMVPDLHTDPFAERLRMAGDRQLQILGGRFHFESNSPALLRLVDVAYANLPRHRLPGRAPRLRVRLLLKAAQTPRATAGAPAPLQMFSGAGFLGAAAADSNIVVLSPRERSALIVVTPLMLMFPYHTRYEIIEFAVFTLASRVQGLASLHGACVGRAGHGVLLMGPSGSGKSTVTLQCLLHGLDFVSEDSIFVEPETMLATGVPNFLHVRSDSLRWLGGSREAAAIRASPVIERRSGVKKFEVDLRCKHHRLAAAPLKIVAIVFLSATGAGVRPLLKRLSTAGARTHLQAAQAYAANRPEWPRLVTGVSKIAAFELRRGRHPQEAVDAIKSLLPST